MREMAPVHCFLPSNGVFVLLPVFTLGFVFRISVFSHGVYELFPFSSLGFHGDYELGLAVLCLDLSDGVSVGSYYLYGCSCRLAAI